MSILLVLGTENERTSKSAIPVAVVKYTQILIHPFLLLTGTRFPVRLIFLGSPKSRHYDPALLVTATFGFRPWFS